MNNQGKTSDEWSYNAEPPSASWNFEEAFQENVSNASESDAVSSEASTSNWKLRGSSVSDLSTEHDNLGFSPYVDAVAAFLKHEDTRPPLTLSIEGEWGTGKSSFMRQLKAELDKPVILPNGKTWFSWSRPEHRSTALTFWFNAWRHDKQDAMWAAFALNITKKIRNDQSIGRRLWGDLKLTASRIESIGGWIHTASVMFLWLLVAMGAAGVLAYAFNMNPGERGKISQNFWALIGGASENGNGIVSHFIANMSAAHYWFAALFFVSCYWLWIDKRVGRRLEFNLKKYLSEPDYKNRISFIENFHDDFGKVVNAYAGKRRVFVFVDDLDRCDVPRAADLMQAINLMIGDDEHLVFILGMDREKIAAGITLKYKDLTPLLKSGGEELTSARHPSAFGYSFLEKFIQITFRVPRPSENAVENFLRSMGQDEESIKTGERLREAERTRRGQRRKAIEVRSRADSIEVQEQVKLVAPALEWNPRRIKQFINDFRLQAYIASDLGLLDLVSEGDGPEAAKVTLEQLGKFVAITLTWPDLVMDLIEFPDLLAALYAHNSSTMASESIQREESTGRKHWLVQRWSEEVKLVALLKAKCTGGGRDRYSLQETDLRVLVNIAPRIQRASYGQLTPDQSDEPGSTSGFDTAPFSDEAPAFAINPTFAAVERKATEAPTKIPPINSSAEPGSSASKVPKEPKRRSNIYARTSAAPKMKK